MVNFGPRLRRSAPWKFSSAKRMRKKPTKSEAELWKFLQRKRFDGLQFKRQSVICGYIADFYCPQRKLIIEVDGSSHRNKKEYDVLRDSRLLAAGYRTARVSARLVMKDINAALNHIRTQIYD